jgi:cytochrome c oxidase subunit IV
LQITGKNGKIHHKDHKAAKEAHKEHKIKIFIKIFMVFRIASTDKIESSKSCN